MYPRFEPAIAKVREYRDLGLHPRAYTIAVEVVERWPRRTEGWVALAHLCGAFLGLGIEAAEAAYRGVRVAEEGEEAHLALCRIAQEFAATPEHFQEACRRLENTFPADPAPEGGREVFRVTGERFNTVTLRYFHHAHGDGLAERREFARAASRWMLALPLLDPSDTTGHNALASNIHEAYVRSTGGLRPPIAVSA